MVNFKVSSEKQEFINDLTKEAQIRLSAWQIRDKSR